MFYILVIRNPENNYASVKRSSYTRQILSKWSEMYKDTIKLYNSGLMDIIIDYDTLISNETYQRYIVAQICCNDYKHEDILQTTRDGWGSSFYGYKPRDVQALLTRHSEENKKHIDPDIIEFYKDFTANVKVKFTQSTTQ